jgi:hypothetical protein
MRYSLKLLNCLLKRLWLNYLKAYRMLGAQPFYSWTLHLPFLITSDWLSGRLYNGLFLRPFGTEFIFVCVFCLASFCLCNDFLVALSSFKGLSTLVIVIRLNHLAHIYSIIYVFNLFRLPLLPLPLLPVCISAPFSPHSPCPFNYNIGPF